MPKAVEIKARLMEGKDVKREFVGSIAHCYGETAAESIKLNSDEVVNNGFIASDKITLQSKLRTAMERGMSDKDLQEQVINSHKPGVAAPRVTVDPQQAILAKAKSGQMSKEELQKLVKQLQAALA